MDILQWLNDNDDVKRYLKVGLLAPELMCAYYHDVSKNPITKAAAGNRLQTYFRTEQVERVMQKLAGHWGSVGSRDGIHISGTIKPQTRVVVDADNRFFIRPYYEICGAGVTCASVKLLHNVQQGIKPNEGFYNSYEEIAFNRLHDAGLMKLEDGNYMLSKTGLLIFDRETVNIWESLKHWEHRKRFFEPVSKQPGR
ncbi:MAG: hypothetical protein V1887_00770 [Candidatus Aenigmatarchaeota archaeon]